MTPDFAPADARYHSREKCGNRHTGAVVNGDRGLLVMESFNGEREGWAVVCARDVLGRPHPCSCGVGAACLDVVFGAVEALD